MKHLPEFSSGGNYNDAIPRLELQKLINEQNQKQPRLKKINFEEFCEWFSLELGRYRFDKGHNQALSRVKKDRSSGKPIGELIGVPSKSEKMQALQDVLEALNTAIKALHDDALPLDAKALVAGSVYDFGSEFDASTPEDFLEATRQRIHFYSAAVESARDVIEQKMPDRNGRKEDKIGDAFKLLVIEWFAKRGVTQADAGKLTLEIHKKCSVVEGSTSVPSLRRAANRAREARKARERAESAGKISN